MRSIKWFALGAAAYLLFLGATFPAGTAYALLPGGASMRITGLSGTVWNGQASAAEIAGIALQDMRWRLSPWGLLLAQLRGEVDARLPDGFVSSRFVASPVALHFRELRASGTLSSFSAPFESVAGAVTGQLSISLASLELRDARIADAEGNIRVQDLAGPSLLGRPGQSRIPLGSYSMNLIPTDGTGLSARLEDAGGPLEVTGTLAIDLERRYRLEGMVRPRSDAAPELIQGLQILSGEPDSAGRYELSLTGSL